MKIFTLRQHAQWISVAYLILFMICSLLLTTGVSANPISLNKPAWASSVESYLYDARFAVDGKLETRWSSQFNDGQWLTIDLGKAQPIRRIQIFWEAAYASQYQLQVSNDHWQWQTLYQQTQGKGGDEDFAVNGSGRYLRLKAEKGATQWGISLKELKVFTDANPSMRHPVPGKIQAEQFTQFYDTTTDNLGGEINSTGVDIEKTSDTGNGYNVGWIESGEWLAYPIHVQKTGQYQIKYRVASAIEGGYFHLELNGHDVTGTLSFNETGGWQQWQTIESKPIKITKGDHQLKLVMEGREFNINWFEILPATTKPNPPTPNPDPETPVAKHGQLRIEAGQLVNQHNQPIQLKGMSSHGLQWFGQFMNRSSIKWLRDDWQANVVRAAMYTAPSSNGYIKNRQLKQKVLEVVDAAVSLGLYVIVDWHILSDRNPQQYKQEAKDFFREVATEVQQKYGKIPNVLYEIANEPNGSEVTWDQVIKPYAEELIPVIRAVDPDAIVIVGTDTWSQGVDVAARNPLSFNNIMYTLHFYAGSHKESLRQRAKQAMSQGAVLFVTEWGVSDASGNGGVFLAESKRWLDFLDQHKISWLNWSLCDKQESSAALKPGADHQGGWPVDQLSASGKFIREQMRK